MEDRIIYSDILIIGGGSVGCMAANRALEVAPSLKVVIVPFGELGKNPRL